MKYKKIDCNILGEEEFVAKDGTKMKLVFVDGLNLPKMNTEVKTVKLTVMRIGGKTIVL